jgi:hypothetical protein
MSFQTEFPRFEAATLPQIPDGFEDISWHNDACPSFQHERLNLRLFVAEKNPDDRECPTWERFILDRYNPETDIEGVFIIATEDWSEILRAIETERRNAR